MSSGILAIYLGKSDVNKHFFGKSSRRKYSKSISLRRRDILRFEHILRISCKQCSLFSISHNSPLYTYIWIMYREFLQKCRLSFAEYLVLYYSAWGFVFRILENLRSGPEWRIWEVPKKVFNSEVKTTLHY